MMIAVTTKLNERGLGQIITINKQMGRILIFHGIELILVYLGMFLLPLFGVSLQLSDPLPLKLKAFFEGLLEYLFLSCSPSLELGLQL